MRKINDFAKYLVFCWAISTLLMTKPLFAETTKILVKGGVNMEELEVLLKPTISDYGPFKLIQAPDLSEGRAIESLIDNTIINFISFSTNIEREKQLLPIMLPLNDGLLGYRICVIRQGTQEKFNAIYSLSDWQQAGLTIGTGTHWSDTPILQANNINLMKAVTHDLLVKMLIVGRFDCFSRGLNEVIDNRSLYESQNMVIEKRLLLVYPFRSLFFVSRKNPQLAERIKTGYYRALADGSWQARVDEKYTVLAKGARQLNLKDRIVIHLDNPFMSEESKKIPPLVPFIKELPPTSND